MSEMTTATAPVAEYVDECGWLIKGHGLTEEQMRAALVYERAWGYAEDGGDVLEDPFDWYECREIWVRKFNQPKGGDYAWLMQETEAHARGAGRFTFVDENVSRRTKEGQR